MSTITHTPTSITPPPLTGAQALSNIAEPFKLAESIRNRVVEVLSPFVAEAGAIASEASSVTVTDATQVTEIKKSRELRLKLSKVRTGMEKKRKELKEEFLRPGQFIDAAGRHILGLIDPVETRLEEQENFAIRKEAERKAKIRAEREAMLRKYNVCTVFTNLADMTEAEFTKMIEGYRLSTEREAEALRKAEEDRRESERKRQEEEARIRAENERLRKEAEQRDAAAKAERERLEAQAAEERRKADEERRIVEEKARQEREAIEAKARAEREANEAKLRSEQAERFRLEREARERREADERRAREEREAAERAAQAPDLDKLKAMAAALREVGRTPPAMATDAGKSALRRALNVIETAAASIEEFARTMGDPSPF